MSDLIARLRRLYSSITANGYKDIAIIEAIDEIARITEENAKYKSKYQNLLAVIHRDGGQYLSKHGEHKAAEDGIQKILTIYHTLDTYEIGTVYYHEPTGQCLVTVNAPRDLLEHDVRVTIIKDTP